MNLDAMQHLANWCESERRSNIQHLAWMEKGRVRVYSTVDGVQYDVTDGQITSTKAIVRRMEDLLATIEREHRLKPQVDG